jgi:isoleucyl-tRNA synthetase
MNNHIQNIETEILKNWENNDTFVESMKRNEENKEFSFYDGPPFATGLPHYGHLLAGTIKDVITRHKNAQSFYVSRRFGWDCHGLPIEYEIDKRDGITNKEQVIGGDGIGIEEYNRRCREIVMRYSSAWESTIKTSGRWVDFKNDYKTLTPQFMESVWWVFGEMWRKNLIYKSHKIMPYSVGCRTALSNFEAGENYKTVSDPALTVSFKSENVRYLVWTTTPWTLPMNSALCVNAEVKYSCVIYGEDSYVLASEAIPQFFKSDTYTVSSEFFGSELVGKEYTPVFNYNPQTEYKIIADSYVKGGNGTGIVHISPAFGEDDYRVFSGPLFSPIDDSCCFTSEVPDFEGVMVKDAEKGIIKKLKSDGVVFKHSEISHSYPFCWRSQSRLIYRAMPNWFVDVPKISERMCEHNASINWVPESVGKKRFHNWISNASPWAISRSRYWGTPIPIWMSDDEKETVIVSSIEQLEKLCGVKISDLHRDSIDHLTFISDSGKIMRRIPEVFDCWFESGSMPYASVHYPFEGPEANKRFESSFPADFIAEGLDQTRGWFYTLLVISTALFDKPAFKNVIVNGIVLAENGEKMSKSLKNYPPPEEVMSKYGADALRIYLISSPAVYGEPLLFNEKGVMGVVKDFHIPLFNMMKFVEGGVELFNESQLSQLDIWIISSFSELVKKTNSDLDNYSLSTIYPRFVVFIDKLSKWYLNFSKDRMKQSSIPKSVLHHLLLNFAKLSMCITPFLSEYVYQKLSSDTESVHFTKSLVDTDFLFDAGVMKRIEFVRTIIGIGRQIRDASNIRSVRFPMESIRIYTKEELFPDQISLIRASLNVNSLHLSHDLESVSRFIVEPNHREIGPRAGKLRKSVLNEIEIMASENVDLLKKNGCIVLNCGFNLLDTDVFFKHVVTNPVPNSYMDVENNIYVECDVELSELSIESGIKREIVAGIQALRKKHGFVAEDPIEIYLNTDNLRIERLITDNKSEFESRLRRPIEFNDNLIRSDEIEIGFSPYLNKVDAILKCRLVMTV